MRKSQKLPPYAKGLIKNEVYTSPNLVAYIQKLDSGIECMSYRRQKIKPSVLEFLTKNKN